MKPIVSTVDLTAKKPNRNLADLRDRVLAPFSGQTGTDFSLSGHGVSTATATVSWSDGPSIQTVIDRIREKTGTADGLIYMRTVIAVESVLNFFERTFCFPFDPEEAYPAEFAAALGPSFSGAGIIRGEQLLLLLAEAVDLPLSGDMARESPECRACGTRSLGIFCPECGGKVLPTGEDMVQRITAVPFRNDGKSKEKFLCFPKGTSKATLVRWLTLYDPGLPERTIKAGLGPSR